MARHRPSFPTRSIDVGEGQLRVGQYADDRRLAARMRLHAAYSVAPESWTAWLHRHCGLARFREVLDVGCGNGAFWRAREAQQPGRRTLCDLSVGMLREVGAVDRRRVQATACRLPFRDACFDAILAHHMLYHADRLGDALAGLRRLLVPGGRLFAATNGARHIAELLSLKEEMGLPRTGAQLAERFGLTTGSRAVQRHFADVELLRYPNALRVTDASAVVDYLDSTDPLTDGQRAAVARRVEAEIAERGFFHVTIETGLVTARRPPD